MPDETTTTEELSLQETLRVMDVARALRKERETVAHEFSRDETRNALRDRLRQTTEITGEELTEADIDAALDAYYDNLHTFRPPPPGVSTFFAHLWVRRGLVFGIVCLLAAIGLSIWWMRPQPIDPLTEAYEVRIVGGGGQQSGIDRYFTDENGTRAPAYYVIVQAITTDGDVLPRRIRNAETGETETVTTWAERVPEVVYERIKNDKQVDGVLDETLFAVKRAGEADMEIVIPGEESQPIHRGGQITDW